jgi:hypothetical protein
MLEALGAAEDFSSTVALHNGKPGDGGKLGKHYPPPYDLFASDGRRVSQDE